jgi:hypothetical protein
VQLSEDFVKILLFAGVLFFCAASRVCAMPVERQSAASTHVLVYSRNAPDELIKNIVREAERQFLSITKKMGVRDIAQWTGGQRIKIYIYDDSIQYQKNTGEPEWSDGASIQRFRKVYSYVGAQRFIDTALPHEMGHIIFRNMIGFENTGVTPWIEEGVSSLQEKKDDALVRSIIKDAQSRNALIGFHDLSRMNIRAVQDSGRIDLFYAQSYSIVKYLTGTFGWDKFMSVCRILADAKDVDSVLATEFGFKDIRALEAAWQEHI